MMLRKQIARKTMTFFCNDVPHKSLAKQLFQGKARVKGEDHLNGDSQISLTGHSRTSLPPQEWLKITQRCEPCSRSQQPGYGSTDSGEEWKETFVYYSGECVVSRMFSSGWTQVALQNNMASKWAIRFLQPMASALRTSPTATQWRSWRATPMSCWPSGWENIVQIKFDFEFRATQVNCFVYF